MNIQIYCVVINRVVTNWYQSHFLGMAEGVTTRLQKEVGQLQKDVEKMESKLDGMAEQLQAEIRLEIMKGIETLRLEMVKNGQNASVTTEEAIFGK